MQKYKKLILVLTGLTAIAGAVSFRPAAKPASNLIYVKKTILGTYFYGNSLAQIGSPIACQLNNTPCACTFTSTATTDFFNDLFNGYILIPPAWNNVYPKVSYPQSSCTVYKSVH